VLRPAKTVAAEHGRRRASSLLAPVEPQQSDNEQQGHRVSLTASGLTASNRRRAFVATQRFSHAERSALNQRLVEPVPVDPPLILEPVPAAPLEPLLLPLKVLPRVPVVVLPDVPLPPIPAPVPLPTEPAPIEPAPPAPPDVPLVPPAAPPPPPAAPPPPPAWAKQSVAGPAIRAAANAVYRAILSILRSFLRPTIRPAASERRMH
jgi:hypothetical protein